MYSSSKIFATSSLSMLLFGIVLISFGTILPDLMAFFEMSETAAGTMLSLLPLGLLIGSVGFGPLVDRFGYKTIQSLSILLIFIGLMLLSLAQNISSLHIAVLAIGIGGGAINGAANAVVSEVSEDGSGSNLSLLGVFFGIGALGMPIVMGYFQESTTFQTAIQFVAYGSLIPLGFILATSFPDPKHSKGLPLKEVFQMAKDPILIGLGLSLFFQSAMEGLTNNWTTSFLIESMSFTDEKALYTLSQYVAGLTLMRLLLGGLLKKIAPYKALVGSLVLAIAGSIMLRQSPTMSVIGLILLGVGFAGGFPIILGYVGTLYKNLAGTAFSLSLAIALIGNMLCNYLMGMFAESDGIGILPTAITICIVLMAIVLAWVLPIISKRIKI